MQINGTSERLTLRLIDPNDYTVHEDNRIRYAKERSPGLWLWHVRPHQHSRPAIRHTNTLDEAKAWFKAAWLGWACLQRQAWPRKDGECFNDYAAGDPK
jgi:hypothetical protein